MLCLCNIGLTKCNVSVVCTVVKEDLGKSPDDLFDDFSRDPIASARYDIVNSFYPKSQCYSSSLQLLTVFTAQLGTGSYCSLQRNRPKIGHQSAT